MKEIGLICISTKKSIKYNFSSKGQFRTNKLKRDFEQQYPNRVWVSDITYLYVNYKPYYLYTIIDLFSREVIGYNLACTMETINLIETFTNTYHDRGQPSELLFHSDQGFQYTSYKFITLSGSNNPFLTLVVHTTMP